MKNKRLLLFMAIVISGIVKRNIVSYASLGPPYETWIGPSAFSTATTVFVNSFVALPQNGEDIPITILYTYYTVTTVLVCVLALKLIWVPVVDMMSEFTTVLSKTLLYFHKSMFPKCKSTILKKVGVFLGTKKAVIWATNLLGLLLLYMASTDILNYMSAYFKTLPEKGFMCRVKAAGLRIINTMQYVLCSKKNEMYSYPPEVHYFINRSRGHNDKQQYYGDVYYMS